EQQPALLAHHSTQAGWIEKAIGDWVKAGQQSFARSSATEAIAQLRKGVGLVGTLPEAPAPWRQELAPPWRPCRAPMGAKGQAAAETGQAFSRSRELSEKLGDTTSLLQVLSGQCAYHIGRGELAAGRRMAEQLVQLAHQQNDLMALRVGSMHMG